MADTFKFELVSPERLLMSEDVTAVVVPGSEGDLTILKGHAPFMTTVRPGIVTVTAASGVTSQIFVRGGFADASPAGLTLLADKAVPAEDLKGDVAAAEIKAAEADIAHARTDETVAAANLKLADVRAAIAAGSSAH